MQEGKYDFLRCHFFFFPGIKMSDAKIRNVWLGQYAIGFQQPMTGAAESSMLKADIQSLVHKIPENTYLKKQALVGIQGRCHIVVGERKSIQFKCIQVFQSYKSTKTPDPEIHKSSDIR